MSTRASGTIRGRCVDCGQFVARDQLHFHGRKATTPPPDQVIEYAAIITAQFNTIESHPDWAEHAATFIVCGKTFQDGLMARERISRELDRHKPQRWSTTSDVVSCTAGCGSYPCTTFLTLTGETE